MGLLDAQPQAAPSPIQAPAPDAAQPTSPPQASADGQNLTDPILKQIEQGIEAKIPPELKQGYMQVVAAGMRVMFDPQTAKFTQQRLDAGGDPVQGVAQAISDLLVLLYHESKKQMSIPAAMLAAITLMCQALDVAEKIGKIQVTKELVAQCVKATTAMCMQKFGIGQEQIQQALANRGQQAPADAATPAAQPPTQPIGA